MTEGAAFTGPTAAALWELPLTSAVEADPRLHVSSLRPTRAMRRPGVVGSQRSSGAAVRHLGLPVLGPEACWISLGGSLEHADLVAVADRLVSGTARSDAVSTLPRLAASVDGSRGVPHVRSLRRALIDVRVGAWSRPETHSRLLFAWAGLPEPVLNAAVELGSGRIAVPDLAWPDYRVCVEYDGAWHFRTPQQWAADGERRESFVDAGWLAVHARAHDLYGTPRQLVARVMRRLSERGCPLRAVDLTRMPPFSA